MYLHSLMVLKKCRSKLPSTRNPAAVEPTWIYVFLAKGHGRLKKWGVGTRQSFKFIVKIKADKGKI